MEAVSAENARKLMFSRSAFYEQKSDTEPHGKAYCDWLRRERLAVIGCAGCVSGRFCRGDSLCLLSGQ